MTSDILTVTSSDGPGVSAVITAVGEIDRDSRAGLRKVADEALGRGRRRLVVDMGDVTFCDSSGLSLLVDLHRAAVGEGGSLRLARVRPRMVDMFRVTHLDQLFARYTTVEDATAEP